MNYYSITGFAPPLKQDLPLLRYDISLYCTQLLKETCNIWPTYLENLHDRVMSYSTQMATLRPRKKEISPDIRIYILDHRLNLLFATLDSTGKIATFMSKFCAQYKKYEAEQYYYGDGMDGQSPLEPQDYVINGEDVYTADPYVLKSFSERYGFVPSELFAAPVLLIFQGASLAEIRRTTVEHCVLLMEKFHSKNLVDLKKIVNSVELMAGFPF